jgi:WD40 repeat protein
LFRFSPSGDLFAAPRPPSDVPIWETATGRLVVTVRTGHKGLTGIDFSPDSSQLAVTDVSRRGVDLYDVKTGRLVRTLPSKSTLTWLVRFAPRGGRVAAISLDRRSLRSWDLVTGEESSCPLESIASCLEFSPDGKRLLVGCEDGSILLHDAATAARVRRLGSHTTGLHCLAFHGGGARAASAGEGVIKIWDVERGQCLLDLPMDVGNIRAIQLLFVKDELVATIIGAHQFARWDGAPWQPR